MSNDDDRAAILKMTPSERFAMVHRLTLEEWAKSGRPLPTYTRSETPVRLIKRIYDLG